MSNRPRAPAAETWDATRGSGKPMPRQLLMGATTRDGSGAAHQVSDYVPNRTEVEMRKVPMLARWGLLRDLVAERERGK